MNEPLQDAELRADSGRRMPYWKLFTDDWSAGTFGLSLEEEGFYLRALIRMRDRKAGLPTQDDLSIARKIYTG